MTQAPLRIGLLGLGTVGAGCLRVLAECREEIEARAGRPIQVLRASVRDLAKLRECELAGVRVDTDPDALVADPQVDLVLELMGGVSRARELVLAALANGKSVVTANKALIAEHGQEIFSAAQAAGQIVAFEAAVAGGIPIIKSLREGLAGNRIDAVIGIINGTTNFILSKMEADGAGFAETLAEAQFKGYAEADPTFDVEGIDAAHKLAILATLAFDMPLSFERIHTVGISRVTRADIRHAAELGYRIKHLALARRNGAAIELRVEPTLVPQQAYVAKIDGVMNGLTIVGSAVGSAGFYGPGAGALATASAVLADVIDIARGNAVAPPAMRNDLEVLPIEAAVSAHYLRLQVTDKSGVMKTISTILANHDISIEALVQKEVKGGGSDAQVVLLTHEVSGSAMAQALRELAACDFVHGEIMHLRVEHLGE